MTRIIRAAELAAALGVHRATLWRWSATGALPSPRRLSVGVVGWDADEIAAWLATRPRTREASAAGADKG